MSSRRRFLMQAALALGLAQTPKLVQALAPEPCDDELMCRFLEVNSVPIDVTGEVSAAPRYIVYPDHPRLRSGEYKLISYLGSLAVVQVPK